MPPPKRAGRREGRGGRVAEEELDVYLAGLLFDGPGGKGVAEAVRMYLGDGGGQASIVPFALNVFEDRQHLARL